jgi:hypothetical protein
MGMEVLVGLRGLSGRSETLLRYVGDMSGFEISMADWVVVVVAGGSTGLRPEPRKSFFVENLRAREEVVEGVGGWAGGRVGSSGVGRGWPLASIRNKEFVGGGCEGGTFSRAILKTGIKSVFRRLSESVSLFISDSRTMILESGYQTRNLGTNLSCGVGL